MDNANRTILIVDDEVHIRRILELKFKNAGFRVLAAKNGQEGLDLVHKESPDAVISDINMPKLDGKTFCLMTDPLKQQRPFLTIMVTARIHPEDQVWTEQLCDTVLIQKPFSPARILETVYDYFSAGGL
ncbi:response regulator [Desulfobacula sp.]|uniref:response regulator n=1 Tax=Desulfobacula sp. TaxID=2593537 RepID=UPI002629C31C|nr:response regulator [Desulfobacula sp.]